MKNKYLTTIIITASLMLASCDQSSSETDKKKAAIRIETPTQATPNKPEPIKHHLINYTDNKLSTGVINSNVKTITDAALAGGLDKKNEFEKTDEFNIRKRKFISSTKEQTDALIITINPTYPRFTYNADKEAFEVKLSTTMNFTDSHSYKESKDFPRAIGIYSESLSDEKMYGLTVYEKVNYRIGFQGKTNSSYDIFLKLFIPRESASLLKSRLSIAIVGDIADPIVMLWSSMELEHDRVNMTTNKTLTLSGVQFWIYDNSTLDILAKYDNNLNPINKYVK